MDFCELASKATEYDELLKEDCQRKKQPLGTSYKEVKHNVVVTEIDIAKPQVFSKLVKTTATKKDDKAKKNVQGVPRFKNYTFKVRKTKKNK